jgi:methyl-accepting chemotaxis protein
MKVTHKAVLVSSAIVVCAFTLFSYLQYNIATSALQQKANENVQETSQVIASKISVWLNNKLSLMDMAADVINQNYNSQTIQSVLDNPVFSDNFILMFAGLDIDGKRISNDSKPEPAGWDARTRPWYLLAQKNDKAVLTEPYIDANTKQVLISATANIKDNGKISGAFGGDISLKLVSDTINKVNYNKSGYTFLISDQGKIISHPNTEFNGKDISTIFKQQKPALEPTLQQINTGEQQVFTAFFALDGLNVSKWLIGVVLEKDKVLQDATAFGIAAIIGTALSVALLAIALYINLKLLFKPLDQLHHSLIEINSGDGDLTKRIKAISNDEFGKVSTDFNEFVQHLQEILIDVKQIATHIDASTQSSASSANSTANNLLEQLGELDKLSQAMNQMSSSAQEVADDAKKAATIVQETDNAATEGSVIISNTFNSIASLVDEMDDTVASINQLEEYSSNIESVLTSITGIAEQTNLLALNAAIEAARAGDMGRGFSVVADEVRALAARTQQSTSETSQMIEQLQSAVSEVVKKIGTSRKHAEETNEESAKAAQVLSFIQASISEINNITNHIAGAVHQQSISSEEINFNANNIRDISQQVSHQAQEQSELCETMAEYTEQQRAVLKQFKV